MIGAAVFIGALLVFLLAAMFPNVTERVVNWLIDHVVPVRWREGTRSLTLRFLSGLESLRSPQEALMIFVTTVIIWLLETGKYWFIMHAFPFEVSFFALMLMNGIVNLTTTLPSAPGYVGTFDAPGIALLVAYGVRRKCRRVHPGATRCLVVADYGAGRLLLLAPTASLGEKCSGDQRRELIETGCCLAPRARFCAYV